MGTDRELLEAAAKAAGIKGQWMRGSMRRRWRSETTPSMTFLFSCFGGNEMTDLRDAVQQALEALGKWSSGRDMDAVELNDLIATLEAALKQPEQATGKESLQVESAGRGQIATPLVLPTEVASELTTTDLAWLETRRLVRVWKELGQMRWMGADEGWDKAIEAVRSRLDNECQDALAWKEQADASGETAKQVLQRMRGLKDD